MTACEPHRDPIRCAGLLLSAPEAALRQNLRLASDKMDTSFWHRLALRQVPLAGTAGFSCLGLRALPELGLRPGEVGAAGQTVVASSPPPRKISAPVP